ncbi:solute:sodium symporter family transporter [Parafilimonas sp.]|uniref:solute:sodium symporter family transporter n=1 Tax=Parafilimonas sp. TaxID=1969739 RepID=UPI0039E596C8
MSAAALISFAGFIATVILISWLKRQKNKTAINLFFAGRRLGFLSIGCALYFTNISATEFIGGSQSAYINNMSVMAWGVSSVFAMLIVSEFIIPVYLRGKMLTTPDFLQQRYDASTKKIASCMFLVSYTGNILPVILYGGAVALNGIFNFSGTLHAGHFNTICILIFFTAFIGLIYSAGGGLHAIVTLDMLLALGLFTGGFLFLFFAFKHLGNGSLQQGLHTLSLLHKEHLSSIGASKDAVPFSTIFTGMIIINLFYWGTEQVIVQQALSGKNLAEIQKGIAVACMGKLLNPMLFVLPGVLAVHLMPGIENSVEVFPRMISLVTPPVVTGIIGAVMFGSVITAFSATLNSAATLFILNIYVPYKERNKIHYTETNIKSVTRRFEIYACLLAMFIAPLLFFMKEGFYTYIQKVSGCFSVPVFTIMFIGFATKWITAFAAKAGLVFCAVAYVLMEFVLNIPIHYLHKLFILFILTILIMMIVSKLYPGKAHAEAAGHGLTLQNNRLEYWRHRHIATAVLLCLMIALFVFFSPAGIAH